MRIASICAASALALGFIHSPALAQNPQPTPLPTASEREEVRTTYIFKFDDSVDRGEMHARAQQAMAGTGGRLRHVYTEVLGGFAATLPSTAVWNVARRPGIVSFEQDQIATVFGVCDRNPQHKNCTDPGVEEPVENDPVPPLLPRTWLAPVAMAAQNLGELHASMPPQRTRPPNAAKASTSTCSTPASTSTIPT